MDTTQTKTEPTLDDVIEGIASGNFDKALQKVGVTDEYLAKKLKRELNAKERKIFQFQGQTVVSDPLIAWDVRQKARMDAHKLKGHYPAEKVEHAVTIEDRLREIHNKRKKSSGQPGKSINGGEKDGKS